MIFFKTINSVRLAALAAGTSATHPAMNCLHIKVTQARVALRSGNGSHWLCIPVPASEVDINLGEGEPGWEALVPLRHFLNILESYAGSSSGRAFDRSGVGVVLDQKDPRKLKISRPSRGKHGESFSNLICQPVEDADVVHEPEYKEHLHQVIEAGVLQKGLRITLPFVGTDPSRYIIGGVHFRILEDDDTQKLEMVATDGRALSCFSFGWEVFERDAERTKECFTLPADSAKLLQNWLGDIEPDTKLGLYLSKGILALKLGERWLVAKLIEGTYPDFKQVIPDKEHASASTFPVPREAMLALVSRAEQIHDNEHIGIKLRFQQPQDGGLGEIAASYTGTHIGEYDEVMQGVTHPLGNETVVLSTAYLKKLRVFEEENVQMTAKRSKPPKEGEEEQDIKNTDPLLFHEGDDRLMVIMPIMN